MVKTTLPHGTVHKLPADLKASIVASAAAVATWQDITPIARNEWICWVQSAKKDETRSRRLTIAQENLAAGKRRPCCWAGCPHR